ncbi:PREDICTED: probable receptor-like protein kinase At5g24010 [Tarenaya hassleriana]|uniref:probable receptor-like protein kinase At5g24010 n=1 Tax=Tarenaya hassleriana TaxID=28532 RepID=UPI0008FD1021|nr:PREDICTED: probable receptor-like protein kinase At5g24010 [Tarenaya hassleriana]
MTSWNDALTRPQLEHLTRPYKCLKFSPSSYSYSTVSNLSLAMAIPPSSIGFRLLVSLLVALFAVAVSFFPPDEYLLDCGSAVDSTVDNRRFVSDSPALNAPFFSSDGSISVRAENPSPNLAQIYRTARVFPRSAKYEFNVGEKGTHMVRLHFHRFNSSRIDFGEAEFHVVVNGYVVLSNFSGEDDSSTKYGPRVREFLIWVDVGKVVIRLVPSARSKFAFVNAVEVISAPKDLIADVATSVSDDGTEKFNGLVHQAMEVVYRTNVGGRKVTPFNDTLWRTWVPDDEFFKTGEGSDKIYFASRIKYIPGGASREVGPDNVYNSARVVKSKNGSVPQVNMTWEFPVAKGYKYLVRMHFCDIASKSLGVLYFNVYINGNLAYQDFDLSYLTGYVLASPFYMDFMVEGGYPSSGFISISVGPSSKSGENAVDAILNAVEIMKMNNSMGSLDGYIPAEMILSRCPNRKNISISISVIAFMCILTSIYIVARRRIVRDGFGWSKLPVDVPGHDLKAGNQLAPRRP